MTLNRYLLLVVLLLAEDARAAGLCDLQAHPNYVYMKLGGFFFAAYVFVGLVTGCVFYRSSRTYRAYNPVQYWTMQIMLASAAALCLYPGYLC